jgi:hypothetical protein
MSALTVAVPWALLLGTAFAILGMCAVMLGRRGFWAPSWAQFSLAGLGCSAAILGGCYLADLVTG